MNNITWVIQTNLVSDFFAQSVWHSAIETECKVKEAVLIPFSESFDNEDELSKIPVDDIIIPYGSCKLTRLSSLRGWRGNCYNPDTFRSDVWLTKRDDMLNSEPHFITVKETKEFFKDANEEDHWFIRPVKDLKQFNGSVASVGDIKDWSNSTASGSFIIDDDTEIMLSPVKTLYSEARYFIVGGKVVDGSYYRIDGRLRSSHVNQSETISAVQKLADKWLPHECCVMDIADTDDGLKVIEWNTINSSGFYEHDIPKIVKEMTNWARTL